MLLIFCGVALGVLVLTNLLFFFVPASKAKLPAAMVSGIVGLGAGVALGIVTMSAYAEWWKTMQGGDTFAFNSPAGNRNGAAAKTAVSVPPMMGGPAMKGAMGGRGPNPKNQLAALVTKLDVLTQRPLSIALDNERKSKVQVQLDGLDRLPDLTPEEAKKRLDALLDLVKDQRATLEAAGYRWPGSGGGFGGGAPNNPPNPFSEGANSEHLKSLRATLGTAPTTGTGDAGSKNRDSG